VESPDQGATFFTSRESSDDEQDTSTVRPARSIEPVRRFDNLPVATGPAPSIFEHPALRSRSASRNPSEERLNGSLSCSTGQLQPQTATPRPDTSPRIDNADVDSPTLGPDNGGLSGLIRQHLRNMSNVSSNYGEQDQGMMSPPATTPAGLALQTHDIGLQPRQFGSENVTPAPSTYSHSNPWDLDDLDNPYRDERSSLSSVSPVDRQKMKGQPESTTPEPTDAGFQWDLTPKRTHERIASNETEADHEAFQRDLAQRQRIIQESLRAKAEGRSTSPAPGPSGGLKSALNMLRAKSSRESFATVERLPEIPPRMPRKLALGIGSNNASSTSLVGSDVTSMKTKPSRVLQQSEQDAQRELENRQRSGTDSSRYGRPTGRSPSASTRGSGRERSNSGTSNGRSRSRPGEYRDDLDQAMTEGARSAYPPNTMPSMPGYVAHATPPVPAERPSLDSQGRMRSRSNSRTTAANYFDSKHLQPIQTGIASGNASPRLPHPHGKFSPGIPISPRPSPGGYNNSLPSPLPPLSASHTPPISNPSTPNVAAFNPNSVQPRQGMLRKKSIAKCDISEPVFLSTTSSIDLVNLPPGASLKNGADQTAPPVPPINPRRKRFGFGRTESPNPYDPAIQQGFDSPRAPFAEPVRTNSSDALSHQAPQSNTRLRKTSSEGKSLRAQAQAQPALSPVLPPGGFVGRNNSPPRGIHEQSAAQTPMDGTMF
jgi:hypothetical protein